MGTQAKADEKGILERQNPNRAALLCKFDENEMDIHPARTSSLFLNEPLRNAARSWKVTQAEGGSASLNSASSAIRSNLQSSNSFMVFKLNALVPHL